MLKFIAYKGTQGKVSLGIFLGVNACGETRRNHRAIALIQLSLKRISLQEKYSG